MKKALSVLLSIILVFSLCVPAFAEAQEKTIKKNYDYYLCFGDSIPAGCMSTATGYESNYVWNEFRFVRESYPWYLMKAMGKTVSEDGQSAGGFNAAHSGMRVNEMLALITGEYDKYCDGFTRDMFYGEDGLGGYEIREKISPEEYQAMIAKADLITVELGGNDIMTTTLYHLAVLLMSEESEYSAVFAEAIEKAYGMCDTGAALAYLLGVVKESYETTDQFLSFMSRLGTVVLENGISEFYRNWDTFIGMIYDINDAAGKQADVFVLSIYNPCETFLSLLGLDAETCALLADIAQPILDTLNYKMQFGSKYSSRYTYVDVSYMREVLKEYGCDGMGVHPSMAGHKVYADRLIDTINKNVCLHEHQTTLLAVKPSIFHDGYSGDVFCTDCGEQLQQGKLLTRLGTSIELPSSLGYSLLETVESVLNTLLKSVTDLISNAVASVIMPL